MKAIEKLKAIFDAAPWLKENDKFIHIPIIDPSDHNRKTSLPALTWDELYELFLMAESYRLEILASVIKLPRS